MVVVVVVVPLPGEDETPDEDDSPGDDEDVPDDDELDAGVFADDAFGVDMDVPEEVPEDLLADDEVPDVLDDAALTVVDAWANVAPMPAAAADSRLTGQVIFLTRCRPRSLDWRAAATVAAGRAG